MLTQAFTILAIIAIFLYLYWLQKPTDFTHKRLSIASFNLSSEHSDATFSWLNGLHDMVLAIQQLYIPNSFVPTDVKGGDWFRVNASNKQPRVNYLVTGLKTETETFVFGLSFNVNCGLIIDEASVKTFVSKLGREYKGVIMVKVQSPIEKRPLYIGAVHGHWVENSQTPKNLEHIVQALKYVEKTPCILIGDFVEKKAWLREQLNAQNVNVTIHPKNDILTDFHSHFPYFDLTYAIYKNIACFSEGQVKINGNSLILTEQYPPYFVQTKTVNILPIKTATT